MADVQKSIALATGVFIKNRLEKVAKTLYFNHESVQIGKAFTDQLMDYYYSHFNESSNINRDTVNSAEAYYIIREAAFNRNTRLNLLEHSKADKEKDVTAINIIELDKINANADKMSAKQLNNKIANMVSQAVEDFIKQRNDRNEMIKSAYTKVVNHTGGSLEPKDLEAADGVDNSDLADEDELAVDSSDEEDIGEDDGFGEAAALAKFTEMKVKQQPITLFESIVIGIANSVVNNDKYKTKSGNLNMEKIVESAEAIYAVLEIANGYKLMTINESLLENVINNI